jgi:hypothetical protein
MSTLFQTFTVTYTVQITELSYQWQVHMLYVTVTVSGTHGETSVKDLELQVAEYCLLG